MESDNFNPAKPGKRINTVILDCTGGFEVCDIITGACMVGNISAELLELNYTTVVYLKEGRKEV